MFMRRFYAAHEPMASRLVVGRNGGYYGLWKRRAALYEAWSRRGIRARRAPGFLSAVLDRFERGNFQCADTSGQQRFTLQDGEQVAIKGRMNLQGMTPVFYDVGVYKARNDALARQRLQQILREQYWGLGCRVLRSCHGLRPC